MEDLGQPNCHVGMFIFEHYTDDNDVDPLFFQVQSDLSTTIASPSKYLNPS